MTGEVGWVVCERVEVSVAAAMVQEGTVTVEVPWAMVEQGWVAGLAMVVAAARALVMAAVLTVVVD